MTSWFNRRTLTAILLIVGAGMLEGCVYDPYTGTYVPCCAYGGYYGSPAYGYPYGYGGYYGYPAYRGYYAAPQGQGNQGQGYQGQGNQGQGYQVQGYQGQGYQGPGNQGQVDQGQGSQGQGYRALTP